jgi:phage shock protein A
MTDAEHLVRLEEQITHLQQHVTEQDKVMLEMTEELGRLRQEIVAVRVQQERTPPTDAAPADERPPHY